MMGQTIEGFVTDENDQPIEGAAALVKGAESTAFTDQIGFFSINAYTGIITVVITAPGYQTLEREVEITKEEVYVFNFTLKSRQFLNLPEVNVQAIRAGVDAPVAQTTVDIEGIEASFNGQDGAFLLQELSPSLIAYSEAGTNFSNYGQFRLRGIDQTRVNITLNGIPLNDMLDQGVFFSNFPDFANSIQSVQIQRGVGTSTNGTSSFAGSINFESIQTHDQAEPSTQLQLNVGSFNTYRASAEFKSGLIKDNWAFYGRFTNSTTDGYRYHSGSDSWSMFFSGGYLDEKNLFRITAFNGRTQSNLAYFPVPLPLIEQDPRTNLNFAEDRDNFGQQLVQLEYSRQLSSQWSAAANLYYGAAGGDFPFGLDSLFGSSGPLNDQINFPLQNRHLGLMVNTQYQSNQLSFSAGLHAYRFQRRNWEYFIPNSLDAYYDDSTQKQEASLFAKADFQLGPVNLYADIQGRSVAIDYFPDFRYVPEEAEIPTYRYFFLNPKLGARVKLGYLLSAYASYGRSSREPTKFDLFSGSAQLNSDNLAAYQDTENVLPEEVNDFEAGLQWKYPGFHADVNLFWMEFRNEIAATGERLDAFGFVVLRQNVPSSFRRGVEIAAQWNSLGGLFVGGTASFTDARIREFSDAALDSTYFNVRPVLTPAWQGQLNLGYQLGLGEISLNARYIGEQFIEPTNQANLTVPSSFVLGAHLRLEVIEDWVVEADVYNLLNTLYYTYGEVGFFDGQTVPSYFVQPPRSFNLQVTYQF